MTVDFIRHTWQDWPSTETPITADELNRLEEGIAGLYSDLDGIDLANIEQTVDDLEEAVENFKAGVEITQAAYDNLTPEEKNNGTVYYITDAPSTPAISALDASYNNSTSGLQATNVQSAVDEVKGEIDELNSNTTWRCIKEIAVKYENVELPTGIVEIYLKGCPNKTNPNHWRSILIPFIALETDYQYYYSGDYNGTMGAIFGVLAKADKIQLTSFINNNVDALNTACMNVYVR